MLTSQPTSRSFVIRRISRGHQITLPKDFLLHNHLQVGDAVQMTEQNGCLTIQPLALTDTRKQQLLQKIESLFQTADQADRGDLPTDEDQLLTLIDQEISSPSSIR